MLPWPHVDAVLDRWVPGTVRPHAIHRGVRGIAFVPFTSTQLWPDVVLVFFAQLRLLLFSRDTVHTSSGRWLPLTAFLLMLGG